MPQFSASAATPKGEPVSPEGTREGKKEYLPSSSHHTTATPEGTRAVKTQDTGPGS